MNSNSSGTSGLDFVIDGSNVLLSNRIGGAPSVRMFSALLSMLDSNGKTFKVWFDNSIYHHVENDGGDVQGLRQLVAELNMHGLLSMMSRADAGIMKDCRQFGSAVINGGDNNDSWPAPAPPIIRCRFNLVGGKDLQIYIAPAGGGKKLLTQSISKAFRFRGIQFDALSAHDVPPDSGTAWAPMPRFKGRRPHGNLLVLALDASPSMDTPDADGGKTRAAKLNEILKATIDGLSDSTLASTMQICLLSFSSDVVLHTANDSGFIFSPLNDWQKAPLTNYLKNVNRDGTNIRLALDRAADFVDGFRQSEVAVQLAMSWKHATVVMLTDGDHQVVINGALETSKQIINHVFATISRSEDVCFGFIGLGDGADHVSLGSWASEASPQQLERAEKKGVRLEAGRLHVKASNGDSNLERIVRTFIDVASSRVG